AIELISSSGFSNIPVIEYRKSIGVIRENRLLTKLIENPSLKNSKVKDVMDESLIVLDSQTSLDKVKEVLKQDNAVLVSDFGRIIDIITRYDLIDFN
ncbi:MAG: CBS domain-containing protein, partial [Ignavibacteria bacterium]